MITEIYVLGTIICFLSLMSRGFAGREPIISDIPIKYSIAWVFFYPIVIPILIILCIMKYIKDERAKKKTFMLDDFGVCFSVRNWNYKK